MAAVCVIQPAFVADLTIKFTAYTHIIDGHIKTGQIIPRKCPTRMIIFIPVPKFLDEGSPLHHKVIVLLHDPHNHPAHPKTKPSANDRHTLGKAVQAAGVIGLTVQKLLNGVFIQYKAYSRFHPCLVSSTFNIACLQRWASGGKQSRIHGHPQSAGFHRRKKEEGPSLWDGMGR